MTNKMLNLVDFCGSKYPFGGLKYLSNLSQILFMWIHKIFEMFDIICPPTQVTCTEGGYTDMYDNNDLRLLFKD
jgi:hypothetical protein